MTKLVTTETGKLDEPLTAISQSTDTEMQSPHVLPDSFVKKAQWLNTQGHCAHLGLGLGSGLGSLLDFT